jgi:hypothetical protein
MKKTTYLLLLLVACILASGCKRARHDALVTSPHDEALAISSAFAANNSKAWRVAVTAQLNRIDRMSRDELAAAAMAYRLVAAERGVQGLESTMLSTLAALGQRDHTGWQRAREELSALNKVLWSATHLPAHPQARVAIKSPGNPVIRHIPLQFAHSLLTAQIRQGFAGQALDLDSVVKNGMCSEGGIAEFEAKHGKEYADLLRSACQGNNDGPMSGRAGAGPLAGMSEFNCLPDHEPTRAERVSQLIDPCLSSQVEGGGNPLATDLKAGRSWAGYQLIAIGDLELRTPVDNPHGRIDEFVDEEGKIHMQAEQNKVTGSKVITFYKKDKEGKMRETDTVSFDANGKETSYSAVNDDGTKDEVILNDDGGYTVKQYDKDGKLTSEVTYDKNSKRVSQVGNPTTGWGRTPECRALTMELMRESVKALLESHGQVDPHKVNPNPEAEVTVIEAGALGCFEMTGGAQVDGSFFCADGLKHCGPGQMVDQNCQCKPVTTGLTPSMNCGMQLNCKPGTQPKEVDGQCICEDAEQFEDPKAGGGPRPIPASFNLLQRRPYR